MQALTITRTGDPGAAFENARKEFWRVRAELLDEFGRDGKELVQANIDASGIHDRHGKVKSWQALYQGSGGGYVAVRAIKGAPGANSPGAITSYLESGHAVRYPSGKYKRYDPQVNVAKARAYRFYKKTEPTVHLMECEGVKRLEEQLTATLEGRT